MRYLDETRTLLAVAAVLGFLGVALGAFGAHALARRVPEERLVAFRTGVQYHLAHAVAIIAVTWIAQGAGQDLALFAGWAFVAGIALFSGSLYALTLTGRRTFGAITPLGGVAFLVGWALVLASVVAGPTRVGGPIQ